MRGYLPILGRYVFLRIFGKPFFEELAKQILAFEDMRSVRDGKRRRVPTTDSR